MHVLITRNSYPFQFVFSCKMRLPHIQPLPLKIQNDQNILNPHLPSGLSHPYQLDKSISSFRGVWCTFSFLLFADSISKLFIWISAEVRSCALQYVFLSTNSAVDVWSHYALEVVEKVVLTVYMCANDIKIFKGIRGLF